MVLEVSSKMSNFHVVLLKTNDHQPLADTNNKPTDRYAEYLRSQNLTQISRIDKINLLCFEFINRQVLIGKILKLYSDYSSLILTSRQTVEAIEASLDAISESKELMESINSDGMSTNQNKIAVYCVGDTTASRFRSLLAKKSSSLIGRSFFNNDRFVIRQPDLNKSTISESDDHKQNGRELARLLVEDCKGSNNQNQAKTFAFYPCSSIRKDDLSNMLTRENVSFDELHVYHTTHSEAGLSNLKSLLEKAIETSKETICLIVFSPSCANAIFATSELASLISSSLTRFKFISVGPSTSSELRKHVSDIFELKEPSPEALKGAFA